MYSGKLICFFFLFLFTGKHIFTLYSLQELQAHRGRLYRFFYKFDMEKDDIHTNQQEKKKRKKFD